MLTINPINLIGKNNYLHNPGIRKLQKKETLPQTTATLSTPQFCYLSFGQYCNKEYTLQGQVKKLAPEQYPSLRILDLANKILEENPDTKKTIYDVHNEYYAPLLSCETLDEAKALYPEFKDVIDASTLVINHDSPLVLKKANRGEIEGVTIQNLSLMLLKQYYGKMGSPKKKEDFFGFGPIACHTAFDALNIQRPNRSYVMLYSTSKPERRKIMSDSRKQLAAAPEYRANLRRVQQERWSREGNEEQRRRAAETQRLVMANLSEEERQARRNKQLQKVRTPEYREKMGKKAKERWKDPKFRQAMILSLRSFYDNNPEYGEIKSKAWHAHPDILKVMSDTLDEFPSVRFMIGKMHDGIPLTQEEKMVHKAYFAECKRRCPDMFERVNGTFSKMWQEYKEEKKKNKD